MCLLALKEEEGEGRGNDAWPLTVKTVGKWEIPWHRGRNSGVFLARVNNGACRMEDAISFFSREKLCHSEKGHGFSHHLNGNVSTHSRLGSVV